MLWQIAATVAVLSGVAAFVGRQLDSPFPRIYTPWTYVAGLGVIIGGIAALVGLIAFIWGV